MIEKQLINKSLANHYFTPDEDNYSVVRIVSKNGTKYHTILVGDDVEKRRKNR